MVPRRARALALLTVASSCLLAFGFHANAASAGDSDTARLKTEQKQWLDPQALTAEEVKRNPAHKHPSDGSMRILAAPGPVEGPLPPNVGGQWNYLPALPGNANPTHAVTGANGVTLYIEGDGNRKAQAAAGTFRSYLLHPNGTRELVATPADMFCAGHVISADGKYALVFGGTKAFSPFKGLRDAWQFNFSTKKYEKLTPMAVGRWYPSVVKLYNGKILLADGLDEAGKNTKVSEVYDPVTRKYTRLKSTRQYALYANMSMMNGGLIFNNGAGTGKSPIGPGIWDIYKNTYKAVPGLPVPAQRSAAASCYFGDVRQWNNVIMGGGWPATDSVAVAAVAAATPKFTAGPKLPTPKAYLNCVNLPNGAMIEAHGGKANTIAGASREVSILSSLKGPWKTMNPLPAGEHRVYHSMLSLERSGCLLSIGSNPTDGDWSTSVLEYCPPYMFIPGSRPQHLTGTGTTPATLGYGKTYPFKAKVAAGAKITRVTLTTTPSGTHGTDFNQRYVAPTTKVAADGASGTFYVPNWRSALPPGRYWVWLQDSAGRISPGRDVILK